MSKPLKDNYSKISTNRPNLTLPTKPNPNPLISSFSNENLQKPLSPTLYKPDMKPIQHGSIKTFNTNQTKSNQIQLESNPNPTIYDKQRKSEPKHLEISPTLPYPTLNNKHILSNINLCYLDSNQHGSCQNKTENRQRSENQLGAEGTDESENQLKERLTECGGQEFLNHISCLDNLNFNSTLFNSDNMDYSYLANKPISALHSLFVVLSKDSISFIIKVLKYLQLYEESIPTSGEKCTDGFYKIIKAGEFSISDLLKFSKITHNSEINLTISSCQLKILLKVTINPDIKGFEKQYTIYTKEGSFGIENLKGAQKIINEFKDIKILEKIHIDTFDPLKLEKNRKLLLYTPKHLNRMYKGPPKEGYLNLQKKLNPYQVGNIENDIWVIKSNDKWFIGPRQKNKDTPITFCPIKSLGIGKQKISNSDVLKTEKIFSRLDWDSGKFSTCIFCEKEFQEPKNLQMHLIFDHEMSSILIGKLKNEVCLCNPKFQFNNRFNDIPYIRHKVIGCSIDDQFGKKFLDNIEITKASLEDLFEIQIREEIKDKITIQWKIVKNEFITIIEKDDTESDAENYGINDENSSSLEESNLKPSILLEMNNSTEDSKSNKILSTQEEDFNDNEILTKNILMTTKTLTNQLNGQKATNQNETSGSTGNSTQTNRAIYTCERQPTAICAIGTNIHKGTSSCAGLAKTSDMDKCVSETIIEQARGIAHGMASQSDNERELSKTIT